MNKEQFSPVWLGSVLAKFPATACYWVAYSGGPDSLALLYSMAALRNSMPDRAVRAIHVNHGLMGAAGGWQRHCAGVCEALNVDYSSVEVGVALTPGRSIEAVARNARYAALAGTMQTGDMVLTAHTEDDQAETLLLQLLRGAGSDGLASMPQYTAFGCGWLGRPLIGISRAAVHAYLTSIPFQAVEDPSNNDVRLSRNYLRHEVLPWINRRWPSAGKTLARSASHLAETSQLTKELADLDLEKIHDAKTNTLDLVALQHLGSARERNAIRGWIRNCGVGMPSTAQLERVQQDVVRAGAGRDPIVAWGKMSVRRYANKLYLVGGAEPPPSAESFNWDLQAPLDISQGYLVATQKKGGGLLVPNARVTVRFRRGGERCRLVGRANHQSLKHLFQHYRIPPWERGHIPLIFVGNELAAVAGYWMCEPFAALDDQLGWVISWHRPKPPGDITEETTATVDIPF